MTYGLRAREISALTLDSIELETGNASPSRSASRALDRVPAVPAVGAALVDYLQHGRPQTNDRHVFFRAAAPVHRHRRGVVLHPGY